MYRLSRVVILAALSFVAVIPVLAQGVVSFGAASYSFSENANPMFIKFVRSGSTSGAVTVTFSLSQAPFGSVLQTGLTATIPDGAAEVSHDLKPDYPYLSDPLDILGDTHYLLKITGVSAGATIGNDSVPLTITNVPQLRTVTIDDVEIVEGTGTQGRVALFTARISGERHDFGFNVQVVTHDGTAHAGTDFVPPASPVFWFSNQATLQIPVPLLTDAGPEGDETFTVELIANFAGALITPVKLTGTCKILDDDNAIGPPLVKIEKGGKGHVAVEFSDPAAAPELVTFSADPTVITMLSSVMIPAGASSATVEVTPVKIGTTSILATAPASRGGRQFLLQAMVFEPTFLTFDRAGVSVDLGGTTTVTAKIDPPPSEPLTVQVTQTSPSIATIPSSITFGTDGTATFTVRGIAAGTTFLTVTLPETRGGLPASMRIDVVVPSGLAITSLSKSSGRAAGNERVQVFGNNMTGRCVVTFGGVTSPDAKPVSSGSIDAATPPHDPGTVDVAIRCGVDTYTYRNAFTYAASTLKLTQVTPSSGTTGGGTIVRVAGENLRTAGCDLWFGNAPGRTINTAGTTGLIVIAPRHEAGGVPLTLRCATDASLLSNGFTYFAADDAPATFSGQPGNVRPGDRLTLSGAHFRSDDAILVNGLPAIDMATAGDDSHTITIPDVPAGTASLVLRDIAGRTVTGPSLNIVAPADPTAGTIPTSIAAGAELVVPGSGLRRGLRFAIGSTVLNVVAIVPAQVTLRVPLTMAAGAAQFTIADSSKTFVTRNIQIASSGPRVAGISPPCAAESGGGFVTINGGGFESGALVQFGGAYSADASVRDANTIVARVPPSFGALAPVITVFNRSGSSATLTGAFTYASNYDGCGGRQHGSRR